MLTTVNSSEARATGKRFAIVASKYNAQYVDSMFDAAKAVLEKAGAAQVDVVRVPGAYEIPVVVSKLASKQQSPYHAIICLGVILRGETAHAQLIGEAVTNALMRIQVDSKIPVAHEVLLLENVDQAVKRCLDPKHNRGGEAAWTAVEMAEIMASIAAAK